MSSHDSERAAMAAAALGEDSSPLVAAIPPPPAKRVKKDAVHETDGWSSFPPDLVRRVADCLLDTNDVNYYMDLRAVCHNWRSATDDPRKDTFDVRFRPLRWIVLAEEFHTHGNKLVLLNTHTGRFLHRELPLLGDYYVVAITPGGFCVLADKSPPHAARVLDPLTGVLVHFAAPVPQEVGFANVVPLEGWNNVLVLLGDKMYFAVPDMKSFDDHEFSQEHNDLFKVGLVGCVYKDVSVLESQLCALKRAYFYTTVQNSLGPVRLHRRADAAESFISLEMPGEVVATHMLFLMIVQGLPFVFKIDADGVVQLKTIGNNAIFIGPYRRCMAVNADNFPGVEANCVYYTQHLGSSAHICKCNIKDNNKVERVSNVAEFIEHNKKFVLVADLPFTIVQILCSYTLNIPDSQLALQQIS